MGAGRVNLSIPFEKVVKMARASQSVDIYKLIRDSENLLSKTKQEVVEIKKEIMRAEKSVRTFEKLSHDAQYGKCYSHYLRSAREDLRRAEKRKERLGLRQKEVSTLLERARERAERSSGGRSR